MIVWGGQGEGYLDTGGRYTPGTNTWEATGIGAGVPAGRTQHTAVWTGNEMIVWGGRYESGYFDAGANYDASAAPYTFYRDADGDGFGDPANTTSACTMPAGYSAADSDCDDASASVHPGAVEVCNGADDDCNGQVDEGLPTATLYRDADGDGHGNAAITVTSCSAPAGYVADATDCNDANAAVHPGALEFCSAIDDDCNGVIDDGAYQACIAQWSADKAACQAGLSVRLDQLQSQLQACLAAAHTAWQAAACTNAYNTGAANANNVYRTCINQANLVAWNCSRRCPNASTGDVRR
jgi:hypothetical protein